MKRFLWVLITSATLLSCAPEPEHLALGTLERERIAQTATINEVIVALPIKQGSLVKKGQLLVQLDSTQQKARVANAMAQKNQAEASLEKLKNGARKEDIAAASAKVAGAKAALLKAKADYERTKNLAKNKLTSQSALEASLALFDESRAILESAKENLLALTNGTRIEDLKYAEAVLASKDAILS